MDFREHQDTARSRSGRLLLLYAVLLLFFCLLAATLINAAWLELFTTPPYNEQQTDALRAVADFVLSPSFGLSFLSILGSVLLMTALSPVSLSSGGRRVAESLHGALIPPQTRETGERRLINVVTEMALASGVPVPPVYILRGEEGINAFAAGGTLQDAVIGVTDGAVRHLTRDELQAVVAHEFSHILNGDMRLNQRFARLLFGLMCLAQAGGGILRFAFRFTPRAGRPRHGGRQGRDSGAAVMVFIGIVALVCYATGLVSSFLGTIIQAAITRQREFLADASSVQFTRNTALASALKKIGGLEAGSRLRASNASSSYAHLFFCRMYGGPLSTHPPLRERILRLEPGWDGTFIRPGPGSDASPPEASSPSVHREMPFSRRGRADTAALPSLSPLARASQRGNKSRAGTESSGQSVRPGETATAAGFYGGILAAAQGNGALLAVQANLGLEARIAQEADLAEAHGAEGRESAQGNLLRSEEEARRALADESLQALAFACRDPLDACRLMLALLLSPQTVTRDRQLAASSAEERRTILAYRADIDRAPPEIFVPLIEMAVPSLKNLSREQFHAFSDRMRQFIHADDGHSFEEWILFQSISSLAGVQFAPRSGKSLPPGPGGVRDAATLLLSALAGVTLNADPAESATIPGQASGAGPLSSPSQALAKGLRIMRLPDAPLRPFPHEDQLDAAIELLGRTSPKIREQFLRAALAVIAHDGGMELREVMFLQLLCLCLGQPVPAEAYQLPGAALLPPEGRG